MGVSGWLWRDLAIRLESGSSCFAAWGLFCAHVSRAPEVGGFAKSDIMLSMRLRPNEWNFVIRSVIDGEMLVVRSVLFRRDAA